MVEVRGHSIRNYGGGKRRRGGGVRSGMRCVIYPCLTFVVVCSFSVLLRRQWQFAPRETPTVPGETASPSAPVVAFAISVTSLELPTASTMLDSAEVLIQSIRAACKLSRYRCEALAFTLPSVSQEGRQHLEGMGWRVVEKDLPVAVEDIENETYRKHVVKSGCCGANEFIKLHAYTLTEYHRVMHVDADTLMLHPMDELMESNASLVYTTDPAMATKGSKALPVQGGFLLVRPDLGVYDELRAIVREGDWKVGPGWRQSHIGYFYGGATIQGLLAYYYNIIAPGNATEVDRCVYNHMSDSDECRSERYTVIATTETETAAKSPEERNADRGGSERGPTDGGGAVPTPSAIKSVHFTQSCMKPWFCGRAAGREEEGSCPLLREAWREGRRRVLEAKGLPLTETCVRGSYKSIPRL